jgi:hypothetical protein
MLAFQGLMPEEMSAYGPRLLPPPRSGNPGAADGPA